MLRGLPVVIVGESPVYCLSIFAAVGQSTESVVPADDEVETAHLVQQIVNAFGARWPAVLSGNSTNPIIPLRRLASGEKKQQPSLQEHKRGWHRFLGR